MCVLRSRSGPVTVAALYAMMGRAAAAGGDGSYSSRSARRGAGGGAAGRGESVRQRGGMGRASVPGPSMAAERGGAGRGVARRPAPCEAARRGGAGEVEKRASPPARVHRPHRTHPSAPPLMFVSAVRDRRPPSSPGGLTAGRGQARGQTRREAVAMGFDLRGRGREGGGRSGREEECEKRVDLGEFTARRASVNLIHVEMTGRTSTKVTQFLLQRWKIVSVF